MKKIGLFVERQRAWGRLLCEGVATFAQTKDDWTLRMLEPGDLKCPAVLRDFDGFVARVPDEKTAAAFRRAGKPVADFSAEIKFSRLFIRAVEQDTRAIGQLAARHFIEHRFMRFAFCGFYGKRFSDNRRDAFVRCLALNRFPCLLYKAPAKTARDFDRAIACSERFASGSDEPEMAAWLVKLPKPVGIFCANDLRALQLLETCRATGFSVPADVAIIGVDNDTLICNFSTPTLSSIDPDAFELGRAAAECLDAVLDAPGRELCVRRVQPKGLVTRASTEIYPLDPLWLSDALVFIRRNVVRHLTASDVYAHLGLSHTRVNAAFRAVLETTVQKEIRRVQLEEARRLLEGTALPVVDIAKRAGFASAQYFCNVFTSAFGRPPSVFRQSAGNKKAAVMIDRLAPFDVPPRRKQARSVRCRPSESGSRTRIQDPR